MADLSQMSDDELLALYNQEKAKLAQPPVYQKKAAEYRAKRDEEQIGNALQGVRTADDLTSTSSQARDLINQGTPTGGFADVRMELGRKFGGPTVNFLTAGFIPDKKTTGRMERFQQLTNEAVLGDVSKLKGPLSDRDIQFLKDTQAGINTTADGNRRALAAREWAATRMKAYESALQSWTNRLGAPSALNPRGQSFDAWWSSWSMQNIPPPSTGDAYRYKSRTAPARPQAPAAGKPASGGYKIISVE
jgi:hypothetical protein